MKLLDPNICGEKVSASLFGIVTTDFTDHLSTPVQVVAWDLGNEATRVPWHLVDTVSLNFLRQDPSMFHKSELQLGWAQGPLATLHLGGRRDRKADAPAAGRNWLGPPHQGLQPWEVFRGIWERD